MPEAGARSDSPKDPKTTIATRPMTRWTKTTIDHVGRTLYEMLRRWPLLVAIVGSAIGFIILANDQAVRVGDGGEYYALMLAWRDTLRPFMTNASWESYARLYESHGVAFLPPPDALRAAFPALIVGNTADFNHFWLYGMGPGLVGRFLGVLGYHPKPHDLFLFVHWLLVLLPMMVAWKIHKRSGVLAIALLFLGSPTFWYLDKVHTELFTVSLLTTAVILFRDRRLLSSAFFISLASTQNISFLAIALFVVVLDFLQSRSKRRYSAFEVVIVTATLSVMFLHPFYYFSRIGALTPQLVAGGASVGANLSTVYLWFLDPDLGLFPNWPFALVLIGVALYSRFARNAKNEREDPKGKRASKWHWIAFVTFYLVISLFAQSSTVTLNSGATPGVARYALWYVPLFFPLIQQFLGRFDDSGSLGHRGSIAVTKRPGHARTSPFIDASVIATFLLIAATGAYSYYFYRPSISESLPPLGAFSPSWSSKLIQTYWPSLYNPPGDVFVGRYSMTGYDPRVALARAVIGPDCRKVFVQDTDGTFVFGNRGCGYVPAKVLALMGDRKLPGAMRASHYRELTDSEIAGLKIGMEAGRWYPMSLDADATGLLGSGWGRMEDWGAWSLERKATVFFPCVDSSSQQVRAVELKLNAFVVPSSGDLNVRLHDGDRKTSVERFTLSDSGPRVVRVEVDPATCVRGSVRILMTMDRLLSPMALGLSEDARNLGVGISAVRVNP